ncbi:39S ribosomal protein L21, mitochondrial [Anabarilius grahami]|uniref:Large ribosomal subunit protein bL21m n=1 Tax=Anabarilius grahami TaxID=495550 RepID=A0A3N0Y7N9_ANAGA|nr:39S ribosomal protein L21, mitochondrial [Anabarilius grahami]
MYHRHHYPDRRGLNYQCLILKKREKSIKAMIVQKVKSLIENGEYGRLFAVVHFAGRQWKVTNEDLILIENHIDAACGDRIRLEKVLLVGGNDFTLIGKPLLGHSTTRQALMFNLRKRAPTDADRGNTLIRQNPTKCLLSSVGAA